VHTYRHPRTCAHCHETLMFKIVPHHLQGPNTQCARTRMTPDVHTSPDVHIRIHPTPPSPRKEQKYPGGHTRHIHPQTIHTGTSTLAVNHAPTPGYAQQVCAPPMCPPQATDGCKEQEASPHGARRKGPRAGAAESRAPAPRPPSPSPWMPVWCAMARRSARPRRRSPALGPGRAPLAWTGRRTRMWQRLPSLAQLPGRCRRPRPQRRPAPDRRGREGRGLGPRVRTACALVGMGV
jgi:hypothetical protein